MCRHRHREARKEERRERGMEKKKQKNKKEGEEKRVSTQAHGREKVGRKIKRGKIEREDGLQAFGFWLRYKVLGFELGLAEVKINYIQADPVWSGLVFRGIKPEPIESVKSGSIF